MSTHVPIDVPFASEPIPRDPTSTTLAKSAPMVGATYEMMSVLDIICSAGIFVVYFSGLNAIYAHYAVLTHKVYMLDVTAA